MCSAELSMKKSFITWGPGGIPKKVCRNKLADNRKHAELLSTQIVNPLPHKLYLEHCIIFYKEFKFSNIFPNFFFLHFNSFENIMENGTFALQEQMFHFSLYFRKSYISKALVWIKGLIYVHRSSQWRR